MEQTSDRVLAYAIELTGKERGKIKGNLYELDYSKHYERVKEKELPADTVKLIYERGEREIPAGRFFNGNPDPQLGKFERFEALPNDPDALQSLLQEERRSREQLSPGDFKAHITALRDGLIETEARRIVREMKRHYEPNSPNKTHSWQSFPRRSCGLQPQRTLTAFSPCCPTRHFPFPKSRADMGCMR